MQCYLNGRWRPHGVISHDRSYWLWCCVTQLRSIVKLTDSSNFIQLISVCGKPPGKEISMVNDNQFIISKKIVLLSVWLLRYISIAVWTEKASELYLSGKTWFKPIFPVVLDWKYLDHWFTWLLGVSVLLVWELFFPSTTSTPWRSYLPYATFLPQCLYFVLCASITHKFEQN